MGGGNDEREQTLNQLLIEMDGFENGELLLSRNNRSDVLILPLLPAALTKKSLSWSSRCQRSEAILKVHAKNKPP